MERVIEESKFPCSFIANMVDKMDFDPLTSIGIMFLLSHFYVFYSEAFLMLRIGSYYAGYAAEVITLKI